MNKVCLQCGKAFVANSPSHLYCSEYCGKKYRTSNAGARPTRKVPRKPNQDLIDMAIEARQHGMTYGQYVTWCSFQQAKAKGN